VLRPGLEEAGIAAEGGCETPGAPVAAPLTTVRVRTLGLSSLHSITPSPLRLLNVTQDSVQVEMT